MGIKALKSVNRTEVRADINMLENIMDKLAFRILDLRENPRYGQYDLQVLQTAYIRSYSNYRGEERRYISNKDGNVYYKLCHKLNRCGILKILIFKGVNMEIGSCQIHPFRKDGFCSFFNLNSKEYKIDFSSQKIRHTKDKYDSSPYFVYLGSNGISFSIYDMQSQRKVAETASVFTEMGWSPSNQDIHFLKIPEDSSQVELVLLILAAMTFMWSSCSFIFRK